jgi:hypothetical protein
MSDLGLDGLRSPSPRSPSPRSPSPRSPNRRLRSLVRPRLRPPSRLPCRALPRSVRPRWPRRCRGPRKDPSPDAWLSRDDLPRWRTHLSPHGTLGRQRKPGSRRVVRKRPWWHPRVLRTPSPRRFRPLPSGLRLRSLRLRLPPRGPPRLRWNPAASRRHGRAARRRVASGPRSRPGTRSCSVVRASETSPHHAPALSLPMAFTALGVSGWQDAHRFCGGADR